MTRQELQRKAWNKASKRARERHPEKWAARTKLREAVRKGQIRKPLNCKYVDTSRADDMCYGRIEAHHYNGYKGDAWKDVLWLCVAHHWEAHGTVRKKDFCRKGLHPMIGENVYTNPSKKGQRTCRACRKEYSIDYVAKHPEKYKAGNVEYFQEYQKQRYIKNLL
jgi:hypothetical protein